MSKKHDGWAIKYEGGYISPYSFHVYSSSVVKKYEDGIKGLWRKNRRKGLVKLVKVKLVEVEN